jgi:hypothetical protein
MFPETHDYRYHSPVPEIDEESYYIGIDTQMDHLMNQRGAKIKGIKEDLFDTVPNADNRWDDEQSIGEMLLNKDEILFKTDKAQHNSPFTKLHCTGSGWVLTWDKQKDNIAKQYLNEAFKNQLTAWTKTDHHNVTIDYLMEEGDESDESSEDDNSTSGSNTNFSPDRPVDEFGRANQSKRAAMSKQHDTMTTALTSNASSSLTASTPHHQLHRHSREQPDPKVSSQEMAETSYTGHNYQFQIPNNNGGLMNLQQFTQLLKVVETQAHSVISSTMGSVLDKGRSERSS